jgi:hypothetical protein
MMLGDISKIHEQFTQIKCKITQDIKPMINQLVMELPQREFTKLHLQISELLMQSLFKVDAVECELDSEKLERRELVKWIQGHLDSIDEIKRKKVSMEN